MSPKSAAFKPTLQKSPPFSVEVPDRPHIEGETIPRRHPSCVDALKSQPEEGVATLFDALLLSSEKFRELKAVGTRKMIKKHNEVEKEKKTVDGKEEEVDKNWTYFEMGPYEYLTFGEYMTLTTQIGAGYRKLGLGREDRVHIFAATSAHWLASAHAAVSQSMSIVTSYATIGEEGLLLSLNQGRAKAIVVDPDLIPTLIPALQKAEKVNFVIFNNEQDVSQDDIEKLKSVRDNLRVLSWEDVRLLGEGSPVEPAPPQPDDLCCLMYTSGTTGTPKGVPITHRNIVAAIAGLDVVFGPYLGPDDSVLAYLPLAHSFEFAFENACLYWGICMGYGSSKTLTDKSMRNCKGDMKEFRPTILIGVPAIWDTMRKGIEEKVNKGGRLKKKIFWGAMALKSFLMTWRLPGRSLLDALVFKTVKKETGDRLRVCFNGAGPIGEDTRRFLSFALVPLLTGYGLAETTSMGALMDPLEWTDDTVGDIPGCIEIKLVDFPDAGYRASNNPPQGEVLIRGDAVMKGYYDNGEETARSLTKDGWFMTGDIGEWSPIGHLKIIDRKKNLVKTLHGEYIALEKLESSYRLSNIVSNICVYAAEDRANPIAIIVPERSKFMKLAEENGIKEDNFENLVHNDKIRDVVLKELQGTGRKAKLAGFEIVEGIILTERDWTVENGLLTPAQKIRRRQVVELYKKDFDNAYGKANSSR